MPWLEWEEYLRRQVHAIMETAELILDNVSEPTLAWILYASSLDKGRVVVRTNLISKIES